MSVEFWGKRDDDTIVCKVSWRGSSGEALRAYVHIKVRADDLERRPAEAGSEPHETVILPEIVQEKAYENAQRLAQEFATIDPADLIKPPSPR